MTALEDQDRARAVRSAAAALAACPVEEREELCLSALRQLWGAGEIASFMDDHLKGDAEFWAATASPATLAAYFPAIADAIEDVRMGTLVRQWMVKAGLVGLPPVVRQSLIEELMKKPDSIIRPKKPSINKAFAASLARRNAASKRAKT